ncbi:uncharacterized protein LOC107264820 isoform X3 [Cephus cinctus]|uniref:Uncharacterized protein LOC107264820 isoform X3 n=1 Tax=Cephus cinctus TaxID=211228 RepID=A0AAJ7RBF4_CEPCN|nr:uncharacterized protein LOC107264820 isoform X3 [Cephus cinctus]XP_024937796.1 uncharacterized protein LOC107264820 isoform X3 [Cephus cinctus]
MRYFWWICWFLWESFTTLTAYPISSPVLTDSLDAQEYRSPWYWERYWLRYTVGLFSITVTAFTLVGCLCCRRHRRPAGFQEGGGKCEQEFKDGSTAGHTSTFESSLGSLELEVSRTVAIVDRVQFEPLPVERIVPNTKAAIKPKPPPPSPSLFGEDHDADRSALQEPCREWFDTAGRHIPREKLKYLREIGRGWFGKVVEGQADFGNSKTTLKNGGVVVRILTEEATTKEKAWFLGEATPYLKLRHRNVLSLLGSCLEADPYLLLFESCPPGDLKGFLLSNRDSRSKDALLKENIPTRIAIEIATGLRHMHEHGFAHTDLSARNCLIASDLSAKLGDYGTGVEKYPGDYYIVGDRALPIRWSAPESIECTETTIETWEITPQANLWSFAVLLWEIVTWGERPYDNLGDEQVIEMLLSSKSEFEKAGSHLLLQRLEHCPQNLYDAMQPSWNLDPIKRPTLEEVKRILIGEKQESEDFEQRWENLRPNTIKEDKRSASLQDLRGSVDSEHWSRIEEELHSAPLASFRLGPGEPVKNIPGAIQSISQQESGSETEEESWRGRVERGAYTEKVRQKSKSVADLMVLVHIDSDSEAEWSMGAQAIEKPVKKRITATGSDGDLRSTVLADEFDEALRKLRDPLQGSIRGSKITDISERPKLLTLVTDQEKTPILRLSFGPKETEVIQKTGTFSSNAPAKDISHQEEHVLRLLTKGDPNQPLLRYVPDHASSSENFKETQEFQTIYSYLAGSEYVPCFSDNFNDDNLDRTDSNIVDVDLWNHVLDSALEQKLPGFSEEGDIKVESESSSYPEEVAPELIVTTASAPDTPQSRGNYSEIGNGDDELSTVEELDIERKKISTDAEEEIDRKHLSTPDDERSSDSGFRDKESCEEEESPLPCIPPPPPLLPLVHTMPISISPEDEQLRILSELDAILDAEYYGTPTIPGGLIEEVLSPDVLDDKMIKSEETPLYTCPEILQQRPRYHSPDLVEDLRTSDNQKSQEYEISKDENNQELETNIQSEKSAISEGEESEEVLEKLSINTKVNDSTISNDSSHKVTPPNVTVTSVSEFYQLDNTPANVDQLSTGDNENEDEDSSTISLRSDNSYVSFCLDEEFVTAIRNELKEKLPRAQRTVVEAQEPHDDDEPSIASDTAESKRWDDDDSEESQEQGSGVVDISIRYNVYGTPLSPILEERESTVTSESIISKDDSRDDSIASKESVPSEDVLLVDTRTNKAVLLEGVGEQMPSGQEDDRDTSNDDLSDDEENVHYNTRSSLQRHPLENESRIRPGNSGCGPLPSPEEEGKWQQLPPPFPLPLPTQDDLMSTSFAGEPDWDSQDEEEDDEDDGDEEEEEEEENSSSSGEFVWKRYDEQEPAGKMEDEGMNDDKTTGAESEVDADEDGEVEDEEEEFTPSAWDATLAPHRSALRSPDKTQKSGARFFH